MPRIKVALIVCAFLSMFLRGLADAAERMLRVSYSAPATAYLPLWAAKDAGFFDRNNLRVELLYVG
jgi:ABC-type nitrate/sulfonate/bicarbonate transport system substrate-binding protein